MGNKITIFTEDQLEAYQLFSWKVFLNFAQTSPVGQDCTFFTRKEILRIFRRYRELCPDTVPLDMTRGQDSSVKVPKTEIEKMPELRVLEETDLDDDGMLSFIEFEHVISRSPDFLNTFHVRI
ncbi:hypothetical protein KUTeg_018277 [Tegillarca granosa]|uniref:EF-hand domain-containing protein n=1 Tax=Tegillarca granosa TaxID=220873 RepID=A0ABQ9EIW5_TEGGR|nr:hypothetical protein KUTeg_018277 [Tegillarca granosa]